MKNNKLVIVAALSLIFASCNYSELDDKDLSGEVIPIQVHLLGMSAGGSEDLARSSAQDEPGMFSMPVGGGILLEMNVKQDESPLRGLVELTTGSHFRVIAIESESKKVCSYGDFVYGSGINSLPSFYVKVGDTYDFICISYNDQTLPAHTYTKGSALPTFDGIDNTKELLWWIKEEVTVNTAADVELQIELKQRMTKVKVIVDCGYNKWKISNIEDGYVAIEAIDSGTLDWSTGVISGSTVDQGLTFPLPTPPTYSTTLQSEEVTILPTSSNAAIKFEIGAVSREDLGAIPSASRTATLSKALSPGVNYTITVRFRTPIFARSNIYWHEMAWGSAIYPGYLTFIPAADDPAENDDKYQGYQGMFFKYGSLVGVSPAVNINGSDEYYQKAIFYVFPSGYPDAPKWNQLSSSATYTTWGIGALATDAPYLDRVNYPGNGTGRNNTFAMDPAQNTPEMYVSQRGDICQYLGATRANLVGYRLPRSDEFGLEGGSAWSTSVASPDGWKKVSSFSVTTNANAIKAGYPNGRADLLTKQVSDTYVDGQNTHAGVNFLYGSGINLTMANSVFPTTGIRISNNTNTLGGKLNNPLDGNYWSGSLYMVGGDAYSLRLTDSYVTPAYYIKRSEGMAVRCVKN